MKRLKIRQSILGLVVLGAALLLVSCAGAQGPVGPIGPQGSAGPQGQVGPAWRPRRTWRDCRRSSGQGDRRGNWLKNKASRHPGSLFRPQ